LPEEIKRFDERDTVFAREDLHHGMVEYDEYYRLHAELKEKDDFFRSLPGMGSGFPEIDGGLFFAPSQVMYKLGFPDVVDGKPIGKQHKLSPERAKLKVSTFAKRLGADLVGMSKLNQAFVYSHRGRKKYTEDPYGQPITLNHKYAISLGFKMNLDLVRTGPRHGSVAETGLVYLLSSMVAVTLADYIRRMGYSARAHHFRNYQVLSVPLAVDGGLGELGRCGFLINKKYGNCLRLATVTTDLPLECDSPVDIGVDDFCEMCKICSEVCPSGAIPMGDKVVSNGVKKWQLDAVKCVTYWNKVGTDCGMCIGSCPWSEPDVWYHRLSADMAGKSHFARLLLLWLYPVVYGKYKPKPLPEWLDRKNAG